MRFDIALMHRNRHVTSLVHDLGRGEALGDVATRDHRLLRNVGRGRGLGRHAGREQPFVEQRRVGRHGGLDVDHVRQHLVVDHDEIERTLGDLGRDGRHGCNRVTRVQHLATRQAVVGDVDQRGRAFALLERLGANAGKVVGRDDRLDPRQRARGARVDADDARMRMRAAFHASDQHAGQMDIGTEDGAAGHLVCAVGPDRALPDDLQPGGIRCMRGVVHRAPPAARICAAASITARTILS